MPFEPHLSRIARQRYHLKRLMFQTRMEAQEVASQMNVSSADLYAFGLIDEVIRTLLLRYQELHPVFMGQVLEYLKSDLDSHSVRDTQLAFTQNFPPESVFNSTIKIDNYVDRNPSIILQELLLIYLHNYNPAARHLVQLFDDESLKSTAYLEVLSHLKSHISGQADFDNGGDTLMDLLIAPARISPASLAGQLEYLIQRWGNLLGVDFVQRLLRGLDFIKEELLHFGIGGFSGRAPVLEFSGDIESERFSLDRDWMPRCVLIAKNSYVWLEQLSRKYGRWIRHLDEIPDEELNILSERGFTGLWLIGLWERSRASQQIKQRMGDHEAVASAYSVHSYDIAADLGGWPALENLRWRAWQRGLRLSADMVPNHMGLDSTWMIEHPDWFLSLPYPPYPAYSFDSQDLSDDPRIGIFIEDHYYSRSDAAVVFKRLDRISGETRYIYHGNDGTSMPWNDTAQLDYSKADVREAVIQTILHVARNFPIIRFDAAMTLARKHVQRLWFPEPGSGGAIPSRSEHGMTRAEYDKAIPEEFWRQVVDRVAAESPDTLLLAEAFWLMEGYFVRTLGMHRVYNSAFMHMLRDEDNAKYRQVLKNVLEFDPQVLKRFVNFMNNPDEKTAVEQFGDTDKYFGVCVLLVTLPGMPMFGHGQIEGFREKYGMEFQKPKWDELPNESLIKGHEWLIFPLLHRRYLFAEVNHFLLYDFYTPSGTVNEDVFAYSNRRGDERVLVVYHNKYAETYGWVKTSVGFIDKVSGTLQQKPLAEGLELPSEGYVIFKDYTNRMEYIRSCAEIKEKGLYCFLSAYQKHVFMDWRFVTVDLEKWKLVEKSLNGNGVISIQEKWNEICIVKDEAEKKPRAQKRKKPVQKKKSKLKNRNVHI